MKRQRWCYNAKSRFAVLTLFGVSILILINFLAIDKLCFNVFNFKRIPKAKLFDTFLQKLDDENLAGNWSAIYTASGIRHLAGEGQELVDFTSQKFQEFGLKTWVETYNCYLNTPIEQSLKLIKEKNNEIEYIPSLKEDELEDDPTTFGGNLVPTFHGYSANGNVTAEYIYVNYGRKEDFIKLIENNISINGKIVIARYGEIHRGLKVKFAQENGAVGVLLYSDPGDDHGITTENGYAAYPDGPARNPSSVQRGSVMYLSNAPGDPTTPGFASLPGVERKDPHRSIPTIPSLPISFRDVEPILAKLNGFGLPSNKISKDFIGGLPDYDYSIGPNQNYVLNLYNNQNYTISPIFDVIGELEGYIKDEVILVGNHRDAWIVGGASDPNSGSASLLEIIRGFKALTDIGFKPLRTIVFASWDGEEIGLLGSTEYMENHSSELQKKIVAYYNVDVAVSGTHLNMESSPSLFKILKDVSKFVKYPGDKAGKQTLYDHYEKEQNWNIGILGSGSDYCAALDHLGIPSVDLGFGNSEKDAVYHYHSNYDSYHWMSTLIDPGFVYHNTISKFLGLMILQLSEHEVIDFKLGDNSAKIKIYFDEISKLIPSNWNDRKIKDFDLNDHNYDAILRKLTKRLNFKELLQFTSNKLSEFDKSMSEYDLYLSRLQEEFNDLNTLKLWSKLKLFFKIKLNNLKLKYFERNFLHDEGLINRSWYKHMIYASGRYTGYEGQSLPGLREAVEDGDFENAVKWINILLKAIRRIENGISF
ncbi:hypothetical protein PACTADRAFT_45879 [Pachysolen tannophilus NRRL Y-2460]|uniref:Vacuolar membrane protease n=1 Tax=Pachysolen tannophilus NRRL Y-2460 TaxID=669874 RepID=A0A1E4TPF0_PACTA|nr:hypothetical protein PACTADRAFT_45879 [Pachysolen tannophilus NRRL Y-2460]